MYRKSLSSKCRPLLEYSIEIIVIKITLKEQIYFLKKNYMYITKKNLKKGWTFQVLTRPDFAAEGVCKHRPAPI